MRGSLFLVSSFLLAGCGGGSSPSAPVQLPTTTNARPQISAIGSAVITENQTAVLTVQASDSDGDQLVFSLSGADADAFVINSSGALSFRSAPNFELPTDTDKNNIYNIAVTVTDGTAEVSADIGVTVQNDKENIAVRRIAAGLSDITALVSIPGDDDIFVTEKRGVISKLDPVARSITEDRVLANVNTDGEAGLLGLAVENQFATSNAYWAFVVAKNTGTFATIGSNITIRRMVRTSLEGLRGTGTRLMIDHPGDINYGGGIAFDANGLLFLAVGDAGNSANAQDTNSQLGKILRLRINPDPFAGTSAIYFLPPADNPFVAGGGNRFVFGLGVQNPTGMEIRNASVTFGDNGQGGFEEVSAFPYAGTGANFGWPFFEGTTSLQAGNPSLLKSPFVEYAFGAGDRQGRSVLGGIYYQGAIASLSEKYIFADKDTGNIWAIPRQAIEASETVQSQNFELLNADFEPDVGTIDGLVAIGRNSNGVMFLADRDGEIFIVEPIAT